MGDETALNLANSIKTETQPGLKFLWYSDLYRYTGAVNLKNYLMAMLRAPGFRYSFFLRLCTYFLQGKSNPLKKIAYRINFEIMRQVGIRFGITIFPDINIAPGFYIVNHGNIFINSETIIGKNCNISQGVTIGPTKRGDKKGSPIIGDNVFIGPGALVIGRVKVGNNVAIGGNSVVTRDVPDNAVVVGNPGVIVSFGGAQDYINRTDYANHWQK
jgi:serine O-acetyltransferase